MLPEELEEVDDPEELDDPDELDDPEELDELVDPEELDVLEELEELDDPPPPPPPQAVRTTTTINIDRKRNALITPPGPFLCRRRDGGKPDRILAESGCPHVLSGIGITPPANRPPAADYRPRWRVATADFSGLPLCARCCRWFLGKRTLNVKLTDAAWLYRAASSDRRKRN